jgi:hypothetical protein
LRRKIDGAQEAPLLHTRRGAGYLLGLVETRGEASEAGGSLAAATREKNKPHGKRNNG